MTTTTDPRTASALPKQELYKTAIARIGCAKFKAGDVVSVQHFFHDGNTGTHWFLVNGEEIAYPQHHLTEFCL